MVGKYMMRDYWDGVHNSNPDDGFTLMVNHVWEGNQTL